jgi:hypothetical protein
LKHLFIGFICLLTFNIFGQEASDYYNRPLQELLEKIPEQIQDTTLTHSGGFLQSYYTLQQWADEKRDDRLKSVCHYDSAGVVQLILHSDCRAQKANGPIFEYYMALTSFSKSIKVEFWNINPKLKDCDRLYRKSLEGEVVNLIRGFVDSTKYIHRPCTGYSSSMKKSSRIPLDTSHRDVDSIFDYVKKDSIVQHGKDSIDGLKNTVVSVVVEVSKTNIDSANRVLDSLERVVDADSVSLYHEELSFFKNHISCKGRIDVGTRLECIDFFLGNNPLSKRLRSAAEVSKYLVMLYKFCVDKSQMIGAVIVTLPDEQKWKAVSAYHRAKEVCGLICQKQKDLNEKNTDQ